MVLYLIVLSERILSNQRSLDAFKFYSRNVVATPSFKPSDGSMFTFNKTSSLRRRKVDFLSLVLVAFLMTTTGAFSVPTSSPKEIYGVPNSGWTAKEWNWGYAVGTGHDCAAICRRQYNSREARASLVKQLCDAPTTVVTARKPENFEEIKLVLALTWQRGRWDGSDGGRGGYGEVLSAMAGATRYESENNNENSIRLVNDMAARFQLLGPRSKQVQEMTDLLGLLDSDPDAARRKCSGLVLDAMGFVENGL